MNRGTRRMSGIAAWCGLLCALLLGGCSGNALEETAPEPGTARAAEGYSRQGTVLAGRTHSLALRSDGTVWSWGGNTFGQLGNGTTRPRPFPVRVWRLFDIRALGAGEMHSLALKSDGTVWSWGNNLNGQLGDGSTTSRPVPVPVPGLTNAVAIAAGFSHSLVLKSDGTVWAYGATTRRGNWETGRRRDACPPCRCRA
ncbi:RCC1 domain-containing protein [Myxococcus qinghaiensis]|uniref:RCC1 domain-containing protein n=1 Tax=Myxococcus qinghaiensis TaxID=2906758 RepID=UPI002B220E25|nr:hypothetical protein [Myxococcus qinghaiensis]